MPNYLSPEDPVNLLAARMNPNIAAQGAKARASMAPPTSIMDPRYAAWKKSQDDAELLMLMSDIALSAVPLAGPAARGAMAAGRALAPTAGRMTENYLVRSGGILPMDVWHGSPHRFPPTAKNLLGEFDASKIGTGEGAQAYGHGLYLAEAKGTAKGYAETLANRDITNQGRLNAHANAQRLANLAGDAKYAADDVRYALETNPQGQEQLLRDTLQHLESGSYARPLENKGNLYKVDLPDEQIAKMLDWDKPLSQQAAGKAALDFMPSIAKPNMTGQQFHDALVEQVFGSGKRATQDSKGAQAAANYMRHSLGIPGIRYLDEGSRSAGKGTSNFVVFDPAHMNIIGRE